MERYFLLKILCSAALLHNNEDENRKKKGKIEKNVFGGKTNNIDMA